ncbi:MAG TPA: dienelactone hydrolase family protein [Terriglobia bacterium]|nr:dienelactone hydrolase family protein [Terriglobia bacterium]
MRSWLVFLCLFVLPIPAAAGAIKTETVHLKSGPETIAGYLAFPAAPGRHPALVVIQEWWGLNDWVKEQAREFARQGYVALAPDLYHGQVATDPERARELMQAMPQDRAVRDLEAAFDYLAARSDINSKKIGSIGWCMGGGLSLQLAIREPRLAACVVNYGRLVTDSRSIQKIRAPVMGNFGAEDRGIPPAAVEAFEKAMKAADKPFDAKIYEGAGHAFENPGNKARYRPEAARNAKARTLAFFDRTLK